jgi:hypothetical protein
VSARKRPPPDPSPRHCLSIKETFVMNSSHCAPVVSFARSSLALAVIALFAACSTVKAPDPVDAAPAASFESLMSDAAKAKQEGELVKRRELYRKAASAYPTRKEPWSSLADSYFEAGDYGNAILAAQEVLQRDRSDFAANSLLAVSGLRISTSALSQLRQQKPLPADTRGQAEEIVRTLREVLSESVLVPAPAPAATSPTPPAPPPRRVTASPTAPAAPAAAPVARPTRPTAPAPAPAPAPSTNPFDSLPKR